MENIINQEQILAIKDTKREFEKTFSGYLKRRGNYSKKVLTILNMNKKFAPNVHGITFIYPKAA